MQDFPTLSHYLSLATHPSWDAVAIIALILLFGRDVVKELWGRATGIGADLIERIVRWFFPPKEREITPARLAEATRKQINAEQFRLKMTGHSLPVGWRMCSEGGNILGSSPIGRDILATYRGALEGRLVILGQPGSGKSVLVQTLALRLLEEKPSGNSGADSSGPIPIIFNCDSWIPDTALDTWLTDQLAGLRHYPALDESQARKMVESGNVLPILDGFDELAERRRAPFLKMLSDTEPRELVLTSRTKEYLEASDDGDNGEAQGRHVFLRGSTTIALIDLRLSDSLRYLKESTGVHNKYGQRIWEPLSKELLSRRRATNRQPEAAKSLTTESLIAALKNPLMVALARDIYIAGSDPSLLLSEKFDSGEDVQRFLLKKFVPAIYEGARAKNPRHWGPAQAERALHYLAAQAKALEKGEGNGVAWWELGGADRKSAVKGAILCGLAAGAVTVLANGIVTYAAVQGVGGLGITPWQGVVTVLGNSTAIAVALGFIHWLAAWRSSRTAGLREPGSADWVIQPSWLGLSISWLRGSRTVDRNIAAEFGYGFAGGSIGGGVALLGILLSGLLQSAIGRVPSTASATITSHGWAATLVAGLLLTLIFGATAGTVAAFQAPVKIESAGGPLELLAADRRLALGGGAVSGIQCGVSIGCIVGLWQGPLVGLGFAVVTCAVVWIGGAISVTAWGQWLIFGRLLLPLRRKLPWRTRAFLRDAHERGVLRQSGAYYQFRHSLLQELYAQSKDAPP